MKKCYKCQKPYVEPNGPGFQEICEGCGSYLHCCQNCYFYDPYQQNSCTEPQAEYVSDPNGMNRCEYFRFKVIGGGRPLNEDDEGRRFKKPDWRNLNKKDDLIPGRRRSPDALFGKRQPSAAGGGLFAGGPAASPARPAGELFSNKEGGSPSPAGPARRDNPFARREGVGGADDKAQKAREALEKLFKKP